MSCCSMNCLVWKVHPVQNLMNNLAQGPETQKRKPLCLIDDKTKLMKRNKKNW